VKKIYLNVFFFFLFVNILVNGGRIPSSDENAIFLLTQSMATRSALDVPHGIIENGSTFNDKFYIWYEVGQPLVAVPFYWLAAATAAIVNVPPELHTLFLKAALGLFNALVGALIAVLVFALSRRLGYSLRTSLILTVAVCISTALFPYFKSFFREPLLTLYLVGGCYFLLRWRQEPEQIKWSFLVGVCSGLGFLTKMSFALNVVLFFFYILYVTKKEKKTFVPTFRPKLFAIVPIIASAIVYFLYNYFRFGNIFEHGYKGGTSFPIPLYVGLFGLLLSPGKGLFFFAPVVAAGVSKMKQLKEKFSSDVFLWIALVVVNLMLHAKYIAWGGDGSWGPRYLLPLLPLLVLPAGEIFESGSAWAKRLCYGLIVLGIVIQLGGTSIYAGNYLRETGEFPYTKNWDDPEFLYKSHFIPNYSPIVGHWRMAIRNIGEHLRGEQPLISVPGELQMKRIPVEADQQSKILHMLDYWFCYPTYVGYKSILFVILPFLLLALILIQWQRLRTLTLPKEIN
jgi:hypothetical protein